ncbi:MAG: hypothetical protein F6K26_10965 [Moorea sp. SIO2I5]|nr:hypothetical protein [Moorena sp. SIO2I5]
MKKISHNRSKNFETIRNLSCLITATTIVLFPIYVFVKNPNSYASSSDMPRYATFDRIAGLLKVYPGGDKNKQPRSPNEYPKLKRWKDLLWVSPDSKSWAHLQFWRNQPDGGNENKIDPLVQVGPDDFNGESSEYTFPCRENLGTGVFGWGLTPVDGGSACERIVLGMTGWMSDSSSNYWAEKSKNKQIRDNTPNSQEITISRTEELTLTYAYNLDSKLTVDVLVGAVTISSVAGQISAEAGTRYVYSGDGSQGTVSNINPAEVAQSEPVKIFLDTANWSSDVAPLIERFKEALTPLSPRQQEVLNTHNKLREEIGVAPLRWSNQLASYAQEWANQLSQENSFRHRPGINGSGAGENIAAGSSVTQMLNLWAEEKDDYDYSTNTCRQNETCGHYTQMVWRNTTEVGCGIAPHRTYGNVIVCNYRPPGNYSGERPY